MIVGRHTENNAARGRFAHDFLNYRLAMKNPILELGQSGLVINRNGLRDLTPFWRGTFWPWGMISTLQILHLLAELSGSPADLR